MHQVILQLRPATGFLPPAACGRSATARTENQLRTGDQVQGPKPKTLRRE